MIFFVVVLVAILTWIVPGGEYQRIEKEGRTIVVPNSFQFKSANPQGLGDVLMSPVRGFVEAAKIISFLFVIGGAFMIITGTGAITAGLQKLALFFQRKPHLQIYLIPVTMTIFSLGGAVFGMSEETLPFVLIFIPLALSLGYDSIVGTAIPFLGAAAGFAGALFNPFTIGIAQSIAEIRLYSGLEYRIVVWIISTISAVSFVMWYAAKIKKNPQSSIVYEIDQKRTYNKIDENTEFTWNHKAVLILFLLSMVFLVVGILQFHWYITEIAALFLGLGIVSGFVGKMHINTMADSFKEGAKDMMGVALIIGTARGILVIAENGMILDSFLYAIAEQISHFHPVIASQAMFVSHGIINFFIHSGSGQAALTMPIMAPLADLVGVSRQTAVLAFQFGDGWINPILPTSGVTMGVLGLAQIPYEKWFKWMLPLQVYYFILALVLLIPPFFINYV